MTVLQCLYKLTHILSGANIHLRADTTINSVTDTDIFDMPPTVYDQIQFLSSFILAVTNFKFPCATAVLLNHIPLCC